jgi:hypothetical protein
MQIVFIVGLILELIVGAIELKLFGSRAALATCYGILIFFSMPIVFILATWFGDCLVFKIYGYTIMPKQFLGPEHRRWSCTPGRNWYAAPGFGMRIVIHILTQAPLILLILLLIVKHLPTQQRIIQLNRIFCG